MITAASSPHPPLTCIIRGIAGWQGTRVPLPRPLTGIVRLHSPEQRAASRTTKCCLAPPASQQGACPLPLLSPATSGCAVQSGRQSAVQRAASRGPASRWPASKRPRSPHWRSSAPDGRQWPSGTREQPWSRYCWSYWSYCQQKRQPGGWGCAAGRPAAGREGKTTRQVRKAACNRS